MPDENQLRRPPELELEELRRHHLSDTASAAQRSVLLSRILQQGDAATPAPQARARTPRLRNVLSWLGFGAALAALAFVTWQRQGPTIQPEPSAQPPIARASVNETLATITPPTSARRCAVVRRGAGPLTDFEAPIAIERPFALPQLNPHQGKWFHMAHDPAVYARHLPLRVEPLRSPTGNNRAALHVQGTAATGWGANVGLDLMSCYDVSVYDGIEFRARGPGSVFLAVQTVSSVPVEFGGECREKCWFNGGRFIVLKNAFETYRVRFRDINTPDGHAVEKTLRQVTFSIQSGADYDFWLDDVKFFALPDKTQ